MVQFKVYDREYDNVRPEYPPILVEDVLAIAVGRVLDLAADWTPGGASGQEFLGRVLIALALTPDQEGWPGGGLVRSVLSNLADMATDAYHADLMVAWA